MIGIARYFGLNFINAAAVALLTLAGGCGGDAPPPQTTGTGAATAPAETEISQESIERSLSAAQEYLTARDIAKAQAILVTLIDRAPREVRARELYGQSLVVQAQQADRTRDAEAASQLRSQAYEQYRVAVELTPDIPGLQQSAGMVALAAGKKDAAIQHFQTAARLDPKNPQYPLFAAQLLIAAKRFDEAQSLLEQVVRLDPEEPIAHASLAIIALELGRFDEALREIGIARKIRPDDVDLRSQEAKIHRRKGDPKRSLELLVGLSPNERAREVVAFEIATAYSDLNDHIKAARAWEHCYQTNPLSPRAWFAAANTGHELLKAGEREQATLWLRQAEMAGANHPEVIALRDALGQ